MDLTPQRPTFPGKPLVTNPVRNLITQMEHMLDLPSIDKYVPVVSKCGLGKTQGTKGTARGVQFDSYWEFAFYIYKSEIEGKTIIRNTEDAFDYTREDGRPAKFYPDFKVDGMYYEVKGRFRSDDLLKREATIGLVTFIDEHDMKPILREVYRFKPNWKSEYFEISSGIHYGKH